MNVRDRRSVLWILFFVFGWCVKFLMVCVVVEFCLIFGLIDVRLIVNFVVIIDVFDMIGFIISFLFIKYKYILMWEEGFWIWMKLFDWFINICCW